MLFGLLPYGFQVTLLFFVYSEIDLLGNFSISVFAFQSWIQVRYFCRLLVISVWGSIILRAVSLFFFAVVDPSVESIALPLYRMLSVTRFLWLQFLDLFPCQFVCTAAGLCSAL